MNSSKFRVLFLLLTMFVFIAACSLPGTSAETTETTEETPTEVAAEAVESAPPTEVSPVIQHTDVPVGLPEKQSGQAADFNASKILESKAVIGGDRFTFEKFERPFNASTMDVYYSEIDIVNTLVYQDATWIYGIITLNQLQGNGLENVKYAIELDTDIDGKGDWLIIASKPSSTEWVVEGVQVFRDANKDVGGEQPMLTDNNPAAGDGFETIIFDQGNGSDPDIAWVRISPNDPNTIELAFKQTTLESPERYLINMWAGTKLIDPALFDISDNFTHEQAGAADTGLNIFYPIKEVAEIDNSCRMAIGFKPTGKEDGLCESFVPGSPEQVLQPGGPGCSATQSDIDACNATAAMSWHAASCSCVSDPPK